MKKSLSLLCAILLIFSLGACGKTNPDSPYASTTVTGEVINADGTSLTLRLGELISGGVFDEDSPTVSFVDENGNNEKNESENMVPPERPNGGMNVSGMTPPEYFTAGEETLTVDISNASVIKASEAVDAAEIASGDILKVTFDTNGEAKTVIVVTLGNRPGGAFPGGFGGASEVTQGESANTITEDGSFENTVYTSIGDDENALRVDGATVKLDGVKVEKSTGATSNTENGDFYGMNAALLATNGANVTINNAEINSSAQNGNGVFSYGSGTVVNISDSVITTSADNSGGIQTTGGGTTVASNLTVDTSGNSSAAIRSDRGGGKVNVTGGSYISNGYNSPAVYSTADITLTNAVLTASNSEALVIEGKNSLVLQNCTVSGNMSDTLGSSSDENVHGVMIYQSMSGDAEVGTSNFTMTGGSLTALNGDLFYVTNTHCQMKLSDVKLTKNDADALLLRVTGNSAARGWGTAGKNGAELELSADGQLLEGDILVDTVSSLELTLENGSVLTGSINVVENAENGAEVDNNAVVTIGEGCTWNLTDDCTITSLKIDGTINYNGYKITLADGSVLG